MSVRPNNEFLKRLENGGNLIVAEGYIFEFERKGYLTAGSFVPEVVLEHPELVRQMYEEFVHAGSDVVLAFTYYAHREKLRVVGRENDLIPMNTAALKMAREVADANGCLMAGNICNSGVLDPNDEKTWNVTEAMFKEQIELAVEYGADYIVGETFSEYCEAKLALDCILQYGQGLPAVITCTTPPSGMLLDGVGVVECLQKLEEAGAAVVGVNCGRGPDTILPLLRKIKEACKGPIAAVPVPYRTSPEQPTFFALKVPNTDENAFPLELHTCLCSRAQIAEFGAQCHQMGIQYVGLCCGNSANLTRVLAEAYGRTPPASKYSPQMEKHYIFGDKSKFKSVFVENLKNHLTGKEST